MRTQEKTPNRERQQTDESLKAERAKADSDLAERLAAIEEAADAVTERARARADASLAASRERTDRTPRGVNAAATRSVMKERAREDRAREEEREAADATLRVERVEHAELKGREREVTDRDLSEERACSDSSVSARDVFLGIVSHDLRNMLGAMVGFAELIAAEGRARESQQEKVVHYASRIQRTTARMARLVGDLVDVASIDAGVLAVHREATDPSALVAEAVEYFQARALESGITLAARLGTPVPAAELDPARILQVLGNLLGNALKFTPAGGRVTLRVERTSEDVRFVVSDTGIGIPAHKLEEVFERYRQVAPGDRRGVGLGLYIARAIVHGHAGRIWAERTPVGTDFCFTVPIRAAA